MHRKEEEYFVEAVNRKKEEAYKEMFYSFFDSLANHAFRILGEEAVSADIVQEIFIHMWKSSVVFEDKRGLITYLYRSVTNNSLKYIRDRNARDRRLKEWETDVGTFSEPEFSSISEEEIVRRLRKCIRNLPEGQREVILLSMEGISGQDIADKLGVSITTVKKHKYRAYKYIREKMKDRT